MPRMRLRSRSVTCSPRPCSVHPPAVSRGDLASARGAGRSHGGRPRPRRGWRRLPRRRDSERASSRRRRTEERSGDDGRDVPPRARGRAPALRLRRQCRAGALRPPPRSERHRTEGRARLQAIPGIGKKTAERIVLELKGSIADANEPSGAVAVGPALVARDALVELGFSLVDAERALAAVDPELPPQERVRLALRTAA